MKAVRRREPLANSRKSNLLNVMFCIMNSPYLFNVEATAFASIRAENIMPIVCKKLFDFIWFII
ncbi:hypothetical protein COK05_09625 [Bacillus cereus]|uniref:Uncharacterized protein n=1 Tax=Bacillus cereus TaxID=1396 RepID=A0A2B2LRD6_BACCE|nr:hypothetical protein COK05_09625 [Bacillus cereus]